MMFNSKNKGFTLVELLVVVSIVSLLSSVVLSSINTARSKGRDTQRKLMVKQIQNALELYKLDNGRYPLSTPSGGCSNNPQGSWMSSVDADCWSILATALQPYLKTLPFDPGQVTAVDAPTNNGPHAVGQYGFSYFSLDGGGTGWCAGGTFYALIYRTENPTTSPGVYVCTGTANWQRGSGTITVGVSAQ